MIGIHVWSYISVTLVIMALSQVSLWVMQVTWTLYGLIGSQLGNAYDLVTVNGGTAQVPVATWIQEYLSIRHSFIGVAGAIQIGFVLTFAAVTAFALRYLNFQKR